MFSKKYILLLLISIFNIILNTVNINNNKSNILFKYSQKFVKQIKIVKQITIVK